MSQLQSIVILLSLVALSFAPWIYAWFEPKQEKDDTTLPRK